MNEITSTNEIEKIQNALAQEWANYTGGINSFNSAKDAIQVYLSNGRSWAWIVEYFQGMMK